ncbi:MAG: hypothetical protein ACI4HZ_06100, partial [Ruminococcus sp.]
MKKLLSLILTIVMLISVFTLIPTANAETNTQTSPLQTTYTPQKGIYSNPYGMVYMYQKDLKARTAQGKTICLVKSKTLLPPKLQFYMRGKNVIYYNMDTKELYSVQLDGKNRKKLATGVETFLGGYGEDVIAHKDKGYIYKISPDGKKTNLFKTASKSYHTFMFGNKVFISYQDGSQFGHSNHKYYLYNIDTKEITTENMAMELGGYRGYNNFFGRTNLYYTDNNKKLIKMDLKGNKAVIDNNKNKHKEYNIYGVNNGATVVYSKRDDKTLQEIFYKKTTGQKTVKLFEEKEIKERVTKILKKQYSDAPFEYGVGFWVENIVICKDKILINVSCYEEESTIGSMVFSMDINGGKRS